MELIECDHRMQVANRNQVPVNQSAWENILHCSASHYVTLHRPAGLSLTRFEVSSSHPVHVFTNVTLSKGDLIGTTTPP